MRPTAETVRMVLSAQMGKAGRPMDGKDLHIGDMTCGILPAAAPLAIGALTLAGMAMAFARDGSGRVALSFIGEGGTSLGEWHEAINLCAVRKLPAVFCVENNQTALSTPVREQSAARVFADKASGYGIPGITIDGTDPDEIAAAFAWAVERARARDAARRSSSSSRCACAATRITTTCSTSARTRSRAGSIRRCMRRATPIPISTRSGRRAIRSRPTRRACRPRSSSTRRRSTA